MKAAYSTFMVLVVLSISNLLFPATACTAVDRRNTIWLGTPGPDGSSGDSMVVRVYRTDKFRYNVDIVDAKVTFGDATLQKLKKTDKARVTPGMDDTSVYTLVNDTRTVARGDEAFMVLEKIGKGLYEIIFRAHYSDFPLSVPTGRDNTWWVSKSLQSFYYSQPDGQMIIVNNITDNRDFNSTTSSFSIIDISASLRNSSEPNGALGILRPVVNDAGHVVMINYGSSSISTCNDGSSLFRYSEDGLSYIGDQASNAGSWIDPQRNWWVIANDASVRVHHYGNNQTIFDHTFTPAQLAKIVSRYSLGSWLGPLVAMASLWVTITVFCAVACRRRC